LYIGFLNKKSYYAFMNLFEYRLWGKTKMWFIVIAPLIVIFLFIQPYVSLLLLLVMFGRFLYVKFLLSALDKSARKSEEEFQEKLDDWNKVIADIKKKIS